MISTIHGDMPVEALEMKTGCYENDNEVASWIEYWLNGELVHRSAHIDLKHSVLADAVSKGF